MTPLLVVLVAGLGTFALRVSLIAALQRVELTEPVERALGLIAPAALGALVAQGLLLSDGGMRPLDSWHAAAAVAVLIALWTRSVAWTLGGGMAALWLIQLAL